MTQEVLEAGPEPPTRKPRGWLPWALGAAVLALLVLANILVVAELATRTVEADNLVGAVEASELAMKTTQDEFAEVMAGYDTQNLTDQEREQLRAELSDVAERGGAAIAAAGDGVEQVRVLPWHVNVAAAQDAYLAHNQSWVDYMAAAAEDPAEWFRPQQVVNDTFAEAKDPLVGAVPAFDLLRTVPRIEFIFVSGSGDSGDGQSA